jgi:hypothetical protein
MLKVENRTYSSGHWVFFWILVFTSSVAMIVMSYSINYPAITSSLIALWMLSLNDSIINKISMRYKKYIQQALRAAFVLAIGLNAANLLS